jgi:hypothetical protein
LSVLLGAIDPAKLRSAFGCMSSTVHSSPIVCWHHRVLGSLWALCGLTVIGNLFLIDSWAAKQLWIVLLVATAYVVTGVGFIFGLTWARRTLGVLVVLGMLFFIDMLLMSGVGGNRAGVWEMLVAIGVAAYTLVFLGLSMPFRSEDWR